jgi:hypothetical protein
MSVKPVIYTSVSELLEHRRDPTKWAYKYIAKRRPLTMEPALDVGIVEHRLIANALNQMKTQDNCEPFTPAEVADWPKYATMQLLIEWEKRHFQADQKAINQAVAVATRLGWFFTSPLPFTKVHEVEWGCSTEFDFSFGDSDKDLVVVLRGTLDSLVEDCVRVLRHMQFKSTGTRTPDVFLAMQRRTWHESSYGGPATRYAKEHGLRGYGGTKLLAISKESLADKKGVDKGRGVGTWCVDLDISKARVDSAYRDIRLEILRMVEDREKCAGWDPDVAPYYPPVSQNEDACGGMHQNSMCKYHDVCEGRVAVSDYRVYETFEPNARYTEEE